MIRSHFSGVISAIGSNASMPALVTTMVIGPSSPRTDAYTPLERVPVGHVDLVGGRASCPCRRRSAAAS